MQSQMSHHPILQILLVSFLSGSAAVQAQTALDETMLEERFIPTYTAGELYYGWSDTADFSGGSMQREEAGVSFQAPLFMEGDIKLTGGLSYKSTRLDFEGENPFGNVTLDLHSIEAPLNLWIDQGKWKYWLGLRPGLAGDLEEVDSDAFTLTALALASYAITDKVSLAGGVAYTQDLGESRVLPALGIIWKPNAHWSLALTAPRAQIAFAPTQEWLFTASAMPSGGTWSVKDTKGSGTTTLNYQSVRAGISVEKRIGTGPAWAYVDGGYQFLQEIEVERGGRTDFDEDLDAVPYVNAGFKLRF